MSNKIGETLSGASQAVVKGAKNVAHFIAEGTGQAADWVKGQTGAATGGPETIAERMDVIASCGKKVGVVDHVEGKTIKLTRNDSPDDIHHFIPFEWVDRVDSQVHLKKNSVETEAGWKADAASCGCGS